MGALSIDIFYEYLGDYSSLMARVLGNCVMIMSPGQK